MAYFDNAATSYPKPKAVYLAMDEFYRKSGDIGRGNNMTPSAKKIIADTRKNLQTLLQCSAKQVIFVPTATIALNIIIQGIIKNGAKNIYISPFEHNAVTRTLHYFEISGAVKIFELKVTQDLNFDLQRIKYQFEKVAPDFVIVNHASNVIGLIAPVEKIFELAKKYNAVTLVDMAQTAGLVKLNVGLETIDFAVFAGHKTLLGPTGVSGFVMKTEINLPPLIFGGTGYDSANLEMPAELPERYEAGTLNVAGIAGLNAAVNWILNQTSEKIYAEEIERRNKLLKTLQKYEFLKIVGNFENRGYVGIVSCLFDSISSDSAGKIFADKGISIRSGLHCAPLAHKFLKTFPAGALRFSVNCLTSDEDFLELEDALDAISKEI